MEKKRKRKRTIYKRKQSFSIKNPFHIRIDADCNNNDVKDALKENTKKFEELIEKFQDNPIQLKF